MTRLGVVVLTYGRGVPEDLLLTLFGSGIPPGSIALVQNIRTPDEDPLRPPDPSVSVLRMPSNLGYAGGMNAGIRHHLGRGCELVLLLTHDVSLRDGAIKTLLETARPVPDFGVVGPTVWWRSARVPFSYGGVHDASGIPGQMREVPPPSIAAGIAECDWIDGCVMMIRRGVFEQIGLFDQRFFMYFEETEFCLRASRAGWRIGVALEAAVEQEPGLSRWPGAYTYLLARNGLEYARLRGGRSGLVSAIRTHIAESWQAIRVCSSPRSSRAQRRQNVIRLIARWRGIVDFVRRRWGPPPRTLPGIGELGAGATSASEGQPRTGSSLEG